ncbi:MAG: pentapeptide repeat-containing protein, partial [Cytophagales bacterium]|nr:pentapeptide repeat-containing protein [Cytophagales bacterium]
MYLHVLLCSPWYLQPLGLSLLIGIGICLWGGIYLIRSCKKESSKDTGIIVLALVVAILSLFWYLEITCKSDNPTIRTALTLALGILGLGGMVLSARRGKRTDKQIEESQEANYLSKLNQGIDMLSSDTVIRKQIAVGLLHNLSDTHKENDKRIKEVFEVFRAFVKDVKLTDPKDPERPENPISEIKGTILRKITEDKIYSKCREKGIDLRAADLRWVFLRKANLQKVNLQWANLQGADLIRAVLQGADLQWAVFVQAVLQEANLQGAILKYANLQGA